MYINCFILHLYLFLLVFLGNTAKIKVIYLLQLITNNKKITYHIYSNNYSKCKHIYNK